MPAEVSIVFYIKSITDCVEECLDFVLNQTCKSVEIFCVVPSDFKNKKHIKNDKRIKVLVQKENIFLYEQVIQEASGQFVIFLNSECQLASDAIEKMLKKANETDAKIVVSDYENTNKKQTKSRVLSFVMTSQELFQNQQRLSELLSSDLSNKLIRLDIIRKNNLILNSLDDYFEQISFCFLCLHYADKIAGINDCLVHFPNSSQEKLYKDKDSRTNLIMKLESFYQLLRKRKIQQIMNVYAFVAKNFLKDMLIHILPNQIKDELGNITKYFSPEFFDCVFNSDRSYLASYCVSIIIPVYNAEKCLARCLDSACNQTLKDIEIICIDDGSTDNSLKILRKYEKKDDRITVIHQENMGQSIARNQGFRISAGEYIHFIDADDYLELNSCEILFLYSKLLNLQMCLLMSIWHRGNEAKKPCEGPGYIIESLSGKVPMIFNRTHLGANVLKLCHAPWATFYSRRFLIDYNIHFVNKKLPYSQDLPFFIVCLLKAKRIGATQFSPYHYCLTSEGATGRYNRDPLLFQSFIFCVLYSLNMIYKLGDIQLFNLYADSYTKKVLKDSNKPHLHNKKEINDQIFTFYFTLLTEYGYNLPKNYSDWCLEYLKDEPSKQLKFLLHIFYNKMKNNYWKKIITFQMFLPSRFVFLEFL